MTDEQTIKAFEYCMNQNECRSCCPYDDDEDTNEGCTSKLVEDVLDLIKRQQAEIERLKEEIRKFERYPVIVGVGNNCLVLTRSLDDYDKFIGDVSAEAIKEFAERVKAHMCNYDIDNYHSFRAIEEEVFDDLVKELTEGSNGAEIEGE
jgi:hypothetical protein